MRMISLASGSKGNCTLVQSENAIVLIDAGICLKELEQKLEKLNISPKDVCGIVLTHEHSDHIKGVCAFCKKYLAKVFVCEKAVDFFLEKFDKSFNKNLLNPFNSTFCIEDLCFNAFRLPHDSKYCVGYSIECNNKKACIATDLGHCTSQIYENIKGSALVFLEANHDEKVLINNLNYPAKLKKRILSEVGHLSNMASAEIVQQLCYDGTSQVVLSHLSEQNNSPSLAYNTIKQYLFEHNIEEGKNIFIDVNTQHSIGTIFNIN